MKDSDMLSDKEILALLKDAQESLRAALPQGFEEEHSHLLKQYSEQDILNVFKICLMKPSGKSWSPIWQVMLLLYQATFSDSIHI